MSNFVARPFRESAHLVAVFLMLASIVSCKRSSDGGTEYGQGIRIEVDIDDAIPFIENAGSSYEVLPLDISTPSFPGEVMSAVFAKDFFVLLDIFSAKGAFGYDYNGKQTFVYDKVGRGPKEVLGFSDVQVYGDSVYVLDELARKIIVLDKNGVFIDKIEGCPRNSDFFAIGEDGEMYFDHVNNPRADEGYNLTYVKDGESMGIAPIDKNLEDVTIASVHSLTNIGGKVSYKVPSSTKVLGLNGGKACVRYDFDFGKYWPGEDVLKSGRHPLLIVQDLKNGDWVRDLRFIESEEMICLSFLKLNHFYYFVYDKRSGRGKTFVEEDKDKYSHPLGFDYSGRLVLLTRSEAPSIIYCTLAEI